MSSIPTVPSWCKEEDKEKPSTWTRENQEQKKPSTRSTPTTHADRMMLDLNKRFKTIYEDEDMDYGDDTTDADTIVARFSVATNLRNKRIDEVSRQIRCCRNVELCFLVDVTGSMQPHIDGVRKSIREIVSKLTETETRVRFQAEAKSVNLSFVGYRDHNDMDRLELLEFTQSVEEFKAFCGGLTATGGADECEDVFGGLNAALGLNWSANAGTKVIFHICDAPCHGEEFHENAGDSYRSGDPNGLTHTDLFSRLREQGIQYHFGKINSTTDKMISMFSTAYGDEITDFDISKVDKIRESVITAVSMSISCSVTRSMHTVGAKRVERAFVLDKNEPDWKAMIATKVKLLSYEFPESIKSIVDNVPLTRATSTTAWVKIAEAPFARGAERLAFYGLDVTYDKNAPVKGLRLPPPRNEHLVLKEYLHVGKGMNSARRYDVSNQMQTVAAFLANEFGKELKRVTGMAKTVRFIKIKTLSPQTKGTPRFVSAERRFAAGTFVRFTNNADYTIMEDKAKYLGIDPDFVQLVTAFSHWTYKVTDRYLMVVDLEGIVEKRPADGDGRVLLTDPAIHCADVTRFGNMNHGKRGMEGFFRTHTCNIFCKDLELQHFLPLAK